MPWWARSSGNTHDYGYNEEGSSAATNGTALVETEGSRLQGCHCHRKGSSSLAPIIIGNPE